MIAAAGAPDRPRLPIGARLGGTLAAGGLAGAHFALRAAPEPVALAAGGALGVVSGTVLRLRRRLVERQIAASFPGAGPRRVRATARACYRHFGREVALLTGGASRIERALSRVVDEAELGPRLRTAVAQHGGAVIVSGHLGNWELGAAAIRALGVEVTAVVQPQRGAFGQRLRDMRAALGFEVLSRGGAARPALVALRSGRILALVADQHAGRGGAPVSFLGRPAWTSLAPARLSVAAGVPLFFAALVRDPSGHRIVHEEIDPAPIRNGERAVDITRRWVRALERQIRARPEQYFWFHRRWKGVRTDVAQDARKGGERDVTPAGEDT